MKPSPHAFFAPFLVLLIAATGCFLAAEKTQAQTHYEIVILAGQSNAVGAAGATNLNDLPANLMAPQSDVLFFSNDGSFSGPIDLQPGSGTGDDGFGPEITFGRSVADANPNLNLCIAKHAVSATDLDVQWNPTGSIYSQMVNTVNRATNSITAANNTYEITGFIWVQGEADANRNTGSVYNANLTNFIAEVRSDFGADMPFFISQLSDNQVYGTNADDELVRQAQQDVAAADANTFLIDTDGPDFLINPAPDNLHYTTDGQIVLGEAIAASYLGTTEPITPSTDVILVQEDFAGSAASDLNGTTPTIGTGTWVSQPTSFNADGSTLLSGNSLAFFDIGNIINDTKGTPDGLFELTATLERPTAGGWYSIGFSQQATPNTNNHFLNSDGIGTIILRTSGEIDMWAGNGFTPNGLNPSGNANAIDGDVLAGTRTLTVQIDVRTAGTITNGTTDFGTVTYSDSDEGVVGTFNFTDTAIIANTGQLGNVPTEPNFNSIMLSGNSNTVGNYSALTLTQISSTPSVLLGDVNLDTVVNFLDISPFIALLSSGAFQAEADCDQNGEVSFLDISPFIAILSGS